MASHEAAHQAVLKLFEAPRLRQLVAFAREQLLAQRGDGKYVEQRTVGIEGERLDAPELPRRRHLGSRRNGCQRRTRDRCRGASYFHEFPAIVRHRSLLAVVNS
jgi:hypothetical protein